MVFPEHLGWAQTMILWISAFQVARIIGMRHQYLAQHVFIQHLLYTCHWAKLWDKSVNHIDTVFAIYEAYNQVEGKRL
jgi:hypothetical protein